MCLVFSRFTLNVSCIVHIRIVLLLVLFSVWSCLLHLDEEGDEWVAHVTPPSCDIILCVIIMLLLIMFSVSLCCLQHLDEDEEEDQWGTHVSPPSTFTKVLVSVSTRYNHQEPTNTQILKPHVKHYKLFKLLLNGIQPYSKKL